MQGLALAARIGLALATPRKSHQAPASAAEQLAALAAGAWEAIARIASF